MSQSKSLHGSAGFAIEHATVTVAVDSIRLEGDLSVPTAAKGAVLFAHGSGSSRHSPRNRYVADVLNEGGLATLLIDLLTADEQEVDLQTAHLRFDIPFLARRLEAIAEWLSIHPDVRGLKLGIFGASTGAAAALVTAAELPHLVAGDPGGRRDRHELCALRPRLQDPVRGAVRPGEEPRGANRGGNPPLPVRPVALSEDDVTVPRIGHAQIEVNAGRSPEEHNP